MKPASALATLALASLIGACSAAPQAPMDTGVCFHVGTQEGGEVKFNKVAENQPDLEHCAAALERMRISFLQLGGGNREIVGAFQGRFLFLRDEGIYTGRNLDGAQYLALVRYQGKLIMPGAIVEDR